MTSLGFDQNTPAGITLNPNSDLINLDPDHEETEASANNDQGTSGPL